MTMSPVTGTVEGGLLRNFGFWSRLGSRQWAVTSWSKAELRMVTSGLA